MTQDRGEGNGWNQWKNYVLKNQEAMDKKLDDILAAQRKLEIEMAAIKVKSGLLGTFAGVVGGILTVVAKYLVGGSQ